MLLDIPFNLGHAELPGTSDDTIFTTEASVAIIRAPERRSLHALGTGWSLSLYLVIETELHGTSCDSGFRTETIVTSVGTLERTSRFTLLGQLGSFPLDLGNIVEAELHRAGSDSGFGAEAIVTSIRALERRSRRALQRILSGRVSFFPRWASLPGAEPADPVGGALAAVAVLLLSLVGGANLPVGVHLLLVSLRSHRGIIHSNRWQLSHSRCRVVTLERVRHAELSRA